MPPTTKAAKATGRRTGATGTSKTTTAQQQTNAGPGTVPAEPAPGGPRYQRVAEALRERIAAGVLPPGAPLPSEAQIIAEFGVSRTTARAAVAALAAEGIVTTLHGRGSFVRLTGDRPATSHRRGITRTGTGRARTGRSRAAGAGARSAGVVYADTDTDDPRWEPVEPAATYRTEATADVALTFGVSEHAPVFVCDRLLADPAGRRVFHRVYVPFSVAVDVPALEEDPFLAGGDLYGVLAAAGHVLDWTETVRARMPSPDDTAALRIPTGTPMLTTRRTTRDGTGRVLAVEETRISADDAQLAYTLTPHGT